MKHICKRILWVVFSVVVSTAIGGALIVAMSVDGKDWECAEWRNEACVQWY